MARHAQLRKKVKVKLMDPDCKLAPHDQSGPDSPGGSGGESGWGCDIIM